MPTWRNELPSLDRTGGFSLRRTPSTGALKGVITCQHFLVVDTHYWGGRTIPCERPHCEACTALMPYRTHVYVSYYDPKTSDHSIFECTAMAAVPLEDYYRANNTLRGCIMFATRPKQTSNGRVVIETNTANLQRLHIPEPPDLIAVLSTIWCLPKMDLDQANGHTNGDHGTVNKTRIKRMRCQPDNQPTPEATPLADVLRDPRFTPTKDT